MRSVAIATNNTDLEEWVEKKKAKERQEEARRKRGMAKQEFAEPKPSIEGKARDLAAKEVGISGWQLA